MIMLKIIHVPSKNFHNDYIVEATSIDAVISEVLPRIRKKSQDFYKKSIRKDLENKGETIVDQHAGNGIFYTIKLIND